MQNGQKKTSAFLSFALMLLCGIALLTGFAMAEGSAGDETDTTYTVQFIAWDNEMLYTGQVKAGDTVAIPDIETAQREYHEFSYWFDVSGDRGTPYDFEQPVDAALSLKAFYALKSDLRGDERVVLVYKDFLPVITDGEIVTVVGELIGFEGCNLFLQWQYKDRKDQWVNIDGANSLTYQFPADQQSINRDYRLGVTILN